MICTSKTERDRWTMWLFLHERGVTLPRSEDFQAIGRLNGEGKLIGVIGYNGFCGKTCQMHDAGERNWVSRDFLRIMFHYPFMQLGLVQVFATVGAKNDRALVFNRRLGFTDLTRIAGGWEEDEDMIVMTMTRSACRWINQQAERKAA